MFTTFLVSNNQMIRTETQFCHVRHAAQHSIPTRFSILPVILSYNELRAAPKALMMSVRSAILLSSEEGTAAVAIDDGIGAVIAAMVLAAVG